MLTWNDILRLAKEGVVAPAEPLRKSPEEWMAQLGPEVYRITRLQGTERPFSGSHCTSFGPGKYDCVCCGNPLFDATEKFESGTGWPSFTQPVAENAISYHTDYSHGMVRVETRCSVCDAHLGHVFPDGPAPGGLRYCMNSLSLHKREEAHKGLETATFGGGCFWCTEAIFLQLKGVVSVTSGYSGGALPNPTYQQVCSGQTGHAEVIQVDYDPAVIGYEDLLRVHLYTHDPTTLNRQGADKGTQYRSVVFYEGEQQRSIAQRVIEDVQQDYPAPIVTELLPEATFYPAEAYHQDYYARHSQQPYCQAVIAPKLQKLRKLYAEGLK